MGFNFSRPQYDYFPRRRPSEYFRVCDPYDCFCGGPRHFRQRNVAVHRTSGGREYYRDPMDFMDDMFDGYGYGMPGMAMGGYQMPMSMPSLLGGTGMPPGLGGMGLTPAFGGLPALNFGGNQGQPLQGQSGAMTWPPEWKDPREWTTRDYDRLGEIMDEYLNRQRGRGMPNPCNQQMSPFGPPLSPYGPLPPMDSPWDSNRRSGRSRPSHSDLEQLRAQMFAYAQEAKEHMQSTNDFLYGSEREQREERYRERQRKMIEEILKGLSGSGRMNDSAMMGAQNGQPSYPGGGGMPPGAGFMPGNPMSNYPMPGMQSMFAPGMESMNPYGGMDGVPQRSGFPRQKRSRGLAFGDDFGGQGGFGDEFGGRRNRRYRRGFDDDDDMLDMGDGMAAFS
ncbi:hypothetical protein AMS68_006364 [Peltaster fructicola]|uniref:Uncharacterized protein n=1 Tax=Peltaster fructicola TaxID=286661 RepID=A0A6H0Y1J0_9PEZI|nr:hypothetical protein AMS68_006364 [Peltaster fructicola]